MPKMTDEDLKSFVENELRDSAGHEDRELSVEREELLDAYHGKATGGLQYVPEGRSKYVSRDVMDTIEWMMPTLMEIFHGSDRVAKFEPVGDEDEEIADQATDYVEHIYLNDNAGFLITYAWLKDGLLAKLGAVKHWWEVTSEVEEKSFAGLTDDEFTLLAMDQEIEIVEHTGVFAPDSAFIMAGKSLVGPDGRGASHGTMHSGKLRRTKQTGRVRIEGIPPEEFRVSRQARSLGNATVKAHKTTQTRSWLMDRVDQYQVGKDVIEGLPASATKSTDTEAQTRHQERTDLGRTSGHKPNDEIEYIEAQVEVDYDGDGIAETRRVIIAGDELLFNDANDDELFSAWSPIITPHTLIGQSLAEQVIDIQLLKSHFVRAIVDELNLSIHPPRKIVPNLVEMDDVLDRRPGSYIRVQDMNAYEEMPPNAGSLSAIPFVQYLDSVREGRTGVSAVQQGAEPGLLKGQAFQTIDRVVTAAEKRVNLIARVFAETGFQQMFKNVLKLVVKYQDDQRMIRLRGKAVPMDPRGWNAAMDVAVNVGNGVGAASQRVVFALNLLQVQERLGQAGNPGQMVRPEKIRNAVEEMTRAAGYPSVDPFLAEPEEAQQRGPDESMQLAMQALLLEQAKVETDFVKMLMEDDRKRDELEANVVLKAEELASRYGATVDVAMIRAMMDRERNTIQQQRIA